MSIKSLMIHACDVKGAGQAKNAAGMAGAPTLTTRASAVRCRWTDQTPDRAAAIYGKYDAAKQRRVYFDSDQSLVPAKDWLVRDGVAWAVVSVLNQGGELDRLWAVDVERKPF